MLVTVARISKDERMCTVCGFRQATGEVYSQTEYQYVNNQDTHHFYFCEACAEQFARDFKSLAK